MVSVNVKPPYFTEYSVQKEAEEEFAVDLKKLQDLMRLTKSGEMACMELENNNLVVSVGADQEVRSGRERSATLQDPGAERPERRRCRYQDAIDAGQGLGGHKGRE